MSKSWNRIDWNKIDPYLGGLSTNELREKFGVCAPTIVWRRKKLGITAKKGERKKRIWKKRIPIDKIDGLLGILPDCEIARKFNISNASVCLRRNYLGVKMKPRPKTLDNKKWDEIIPFLGKIPDREVARKFKVGNGMVGFVRNKLKIPLYKKQKRYKEILTDEQKKEIRKIAHMKTAMKMRGRKQSKEEIEKRKKSLLAYRMANPEKYKKQVEKRMKASVKSNGKCKIYQTNAGAVQGNFEYRYIKELEKEGKRLPKKCKNPIRTPFGLYLPDFEYPDRYIEIKSPYTYRVCIGEIGYFSQAKSDLQMKKINFVRENIAPVQLIIIDK